MGPTQCALLCTFCYVWSKPSPRLPPCGFFLLLIPRPLLLLIFFLPSSTVFLGEQRVVVALAALHSSTSLRLQITRFFATTAPLQIWGGKGTSFFITVFSEQLTCWAVCVCAQMCYRLNEFSLSLLSHNTKN